MSLWQGFLINVQFFTVIPVRRELSMEREPLTRSVQTFPILGLLQGLLSAALLYGLIEWTPFSSLAIAFITWVFLMALTGGLHLDGWMDASDAFFSYRDLGKRLEIMKDPRTGAFGVLSVIVLLSARFLFLYEIIQMATFSSYVLIAAIPFLSKSVMGYFLLSIKPSKQEGLAYFFQKSIQRSSLWIYPIYWIALIGMMVLLSPEVFLGMLLLSALTVLFTIVMRRKILSWFNGVTGDVLGASVEGMEVILWMSVWLLHYFVMG
ncbi:adenosylcobinamide-GDP ribazoletransferase [Pseudalkalibacillus sp. NRS-1564]|uniref:adenosylcobinamide-GDP ribazoletransferase n=1 Tax=Pseudalkalibacillus sp. NRS-1564 TaxID=3233900 RepID=UPI003D297609